MTKPKTDFLFIPNLSKFSLSHIIKLEKMGGLWFSDVCQDLQMCVQDMRIGVGRSVVCKMMSNRFHNDNRKINRGKHNATTMMINYRNNGAKQRF